MSPPPSDGIRSRIVDIGGPTHVADLGGPAGGPLVVAVHGLGGSHLNWTAVAPLLTGRCRVVAVDLVGHGLTPAGTRSPDIEGHRRLLSGILASLGGGPVILMGNSMGGLVAALQAAAEPDSVAGLILIDPALPTARPGLIHPRVVANFVLCAVPGLGEGYLTQRRRRTTAEHTVRRVLGTCCVDPSRVPVDVVDAHIELTARLDRARGDEAYLRSARSLSLMMAAPGSTMRRLAGLTPPTVLIHGARDMLVPLSSARRMAADHPDWRFDIGTDIGHVPMLEAPTWTAAVIDDWLDHEGAAAASRASRAPAAEADPVG